MFSSLNCYLYVNRYSFGSSLQTKLSPAASFVGSSVYWCPRCHKLGLGSTPTITTDRSAPLSSRGDYSFSIIALILIFLIIPLWLVGYWDFLIFRYCQKSVIAVKKSYSLESEGYSEVILTDRNGESVLKRNSVNDQSGWELKGNIFTKSNRKP